MGGPDGIGLINDDVGGLLRDVITHQHEMDTDEDPIAEAEALRKLCEEAETPLFSGCQYSKLSFMIGMYQIKSGGNVSDRVFTDFLVFLKKVFPHVDIPSTFYETKKLIRKMKCDYTKIDVCRNDCMLFRNKAKDEEVYRVCKQSSWKDIPHNYHHFRIRNQKKKWLLRYYDTFR